MITRDEARSKSEKIVNFYKSVNRKTTYKVEPQSERDKKQKVWRLNVVERDENAEKFASFIKTEVQARKKNPYKKGKIPKAEPKAAPIKKVAKIKPAVQTYTTRPLPSAYREINNKELLRENSVRGQCWKLHNEGKNSEEISDILGITRRTVTRNIYIRRAQLGIAAPQRSNPLLGIYDPNSATSKYWEMRQQGATVQEIAQHYNVSKIKVSNAISVRTAKLGLESKSKELKKRVHKLRDEGKTLPEISKIIGRTCDQLRYFYKLK